MNSIRSPLQSYIVVDNSFLVMLSEFLFDTAGKDFSGAEFLSNLGQSICEQIKFLRQFAVDNCIYCSDLVAREFQPWNSDRINGLGKIPFREKKGLARQVTGLLEQQHVEQVYFDILRNQPDAPKRLVGPGGLSNEDLSLIMVGIELSEKGKPVYVLSNDQDLLAFTSWLHGKPEALELWPEINHMQGLHCLTYLELIHRSCYISTESIQNLITFYMRDHYVRKELAGTAKGQSIFDQLLQIQSNLTQSAAEKARIRGARA